jgi:hypothetical protein
MYTVIGSIVTLAVVTLAVVTLAVVITILVVMVSGAQIVIGRLIRVAPDVIVFFGNIVGIIVVNTIQ